MKTTLLTLVLFIVLDNLVSAQVVLNEVYTDPSPGKQEFFELYNTSTSQIPENLDNYTMITYYEESGKTGFYVLDLPNSTINAKSFFTGAATSIFNVQKLTNITADFSWNNTTATSSLSKWENNGTGYTQVSVPPNLNDLFEKKSGSGGGYHIFVFKNAVLINGLIGGSSSSTIPSYIKSMPSLPVDMIAPSPDFAVNFSAIADNQVEYVTATPGSDNGYIRTTDGKCGVWEKGSAQAEHTPGTTNGSAVGQIGQLTITSFISVGSPSILNYQITAGSADAFPATVEAYRDFGIIGQLDASDILFDSRKIVSVSAGLQQIVLVNSSDQVMLVAKSPAGCYDKVISITNFELSILLPVKLESFTALLHNNMADLRWTTASEINGNHFVVEKSTDGKTFDNAGIVFAYGNATGKTNYNFSDNLINVQSGIIYYRLRIVDNDGKSEYSQTRIIRISKQSINTITILTYPNPVSNELRVTIPAEWQNKKVVYEVINANGQVAKKAETTSSGQTENLNVSSLARGLYFVIVSCDGQTAQQKVIKN